MIIIPFTTKLITTAILAICGMSMLMTPINYNVELSEYGQELIEDYEFCVEWFDKEDAINYEEALNDYIVDIEKEEYITSDGERIEIYIRENRHQELDIDFRQLFKELPKEIQNEIKEEESIASKVNRDFNIEDVVTRKYIEWFYYEINQKGMM